MTDQKRRAVVLLSGGLDSATVLAIAQSEGIKCHALSVDYGQRHATELAAAGRIAEKLGAAQHIVIPLDLRVFGGSALTEEEIEVPNPESIEDIGDDIPATYVPARNTILLALALAYAESIDAADIYIGANAVDYSGYPDCRPEFIEAFENTANLATRIGVEGRKITIHTPIMKMTKAEIIHRGTELGVPFELTHSCYDPSPEGLACGQCDSCLLRRQGFIDAAVPDPTRYAF